MNIIDCLQWLGALGTFGCCAGMAWTVDEPADPWPERRITGFDRDEAGDWFARLECGHTRHVRHDPPWQNRPWVTSEDGRRAHVGRTLGCRRCAEGG